MAPAPTPSRSIYGFVFFLCSGAGLVLYLTWAYVPTAWLHAAGLTYWPQKYWAVALPTVAIVWIFIFATCLYPGLVMIMTPPLSSMRTITDSYAVTEIKQQPEGSIPAIRDIPISEICRVLYLNDNKAE